MHIDMYVEIEMAVCVGVNGCVRVCVGVCVGVCVCVLCHMSEHCCGMGEDRQVVMAADYLSSGVVNVLLTLL